MLDEKREYACYTGDVDEILSSEGYRLRSRTFLGNHFSGARRAMEIIARKHLFADGESWPSPARMQEVENILRHWCRSTYSAKPGAASANASALKPLALELFDLDCWAERYILALCKSKRKSSDETRKLCKSWSDKTHRKAQSFDAVLFDAESQWQNDSNRIAYQRVIADALLLGPLKTRYLVGNAKMLEKVKPLEGSKRKLDSRSYRYVLALMVAILLQGGCAGNKVEGFVEIEPERIMDWLGIERDFPKGKVLDWVWEAGDGPRSLFTAISDGERQSLWHIDDGWLKAGGWKLVEASETEALREAARKSEEGLTIYGDTREETLTPVFWLSQPHTVLV